ncbi:heparan-alpha-glucosaminide N-acetyltransferase domain-containing protein [Nakamurella aerolata]|uniref:DUF1624 domain-containing protein n=1 Tax=Nakamurella aerolata TaxID=1656892 RepID=A0A849AAK9_9ACTN|nr:heparan-alpha-glucosaminide N-acetyltransferase domain-containing protein [Nakamurella aerolata]NNG37549.1 DUF1624 domain-containing protein [Nakamurella aerolata]
MATTLRTERNERSAARLVGIDLARTLALLGMFVAHTGALGGPSGAPDALKSVAGGRSAALFAVLAGVSVALATRPGRSGRVRGALVMRAALITLIGMLLGIPDSGVAVILVNYGLLFLVAVPLIRLPAGALLVAAAVWGVLSPWLSLLIRRHLPPSTGQNPSFDSLQDPGQLLGEVVFTGYYPVFTWTTYLLVGMGIGRLNLRATRTAAAMVAVGAALAGAALVVAAWVGSGAGARSALLADSSGLNVSTWPELRDALADGMYGTSPTGTAWWLGVWSPHSGSIVDFAHTTGTALLTLGAALLLVQWTGPRLLRCWQILCGAGTMTLSLYSVHVVALSLGEPGDAVRQWIPHVLAALLIGAACAALRRRGPLETFVSLMSNTVRLSGRHARANGPT